MNFKYFNKKSNIETHVDMMESTNELVATWTKELANWKCTYVTISLEKALLYVNNDLLPGSLTRDLLLVYHRQIFVIIMFLSEINSYYEKVHCVRFYKTC